MGATFIVLDHYKLSLTSFNFVGRQNIDKEIV